MKKPAVVSLVVLALLSLSSTSSFADTGDAPAGAAAKPPRKARKPARPAASTAPKKGAPVTTAAAAAVADPPAPIPAPATSPVARTEEPAKTSSSSSSSPPMRDEPNAPHAADTNADKAIALAPLVGYASENLKLGFGARASYTFENHVSIAGTFVYHLGTSTETTSFNGVAASSSVHAFYPAAEGGYDFHIERFMIRPYMGLGVLFVGSTVKVGNQETSDTKNRFTLYPGVTASYDIPESAFFAGADMRLLIVPDGGDPSFGMFATFGVRL